MLTHMPMRGKFKINSITLPIYMLEISPHTKRELFAKSIGPGCRPWMRNAPNITAVAADPGMPKVSKGTRAPPAAALFAPSGATTPSTTPVFHF